MLFARARCAFVTCSLLATLLLGGCGKEASPVYPESQGSVASTQDMSGLSREIMRELSNYRARNGRSPVRPDTSLMQMANLHSQAMAEGRIPLGHHNFDRRKADLQENFKSISSMAENVGVLNAGGTSDLALAKQIVKLWAGSPRHNANMLGDYYIVGVGAVRGEGGKVYITAVFAKLGG